MTYNKKTRNEEMETELREDKIREQANEIDDGSFDTWKDENKEELVKKFIDDSQDRFKEFCEGLKDEYIDRNENEFIDYCKYEWNEYNENL